MDTSQERGRATDASSKASLVAKRLESGGAQFCADYRSYTDALPASILQNGLGQALATELAAGGRQSGKDSAHHLLFDHVQDWLCDAKAGVFSGSKDLLGSIMAGTEDEYVHAQGEALSWLTWHKKFCRAVLPDRKEAKVLDDLDKAKGNQPHG